MVGGFRVRPSEPRASARWAHAMPSALAVGLLLLACSGERIIVAEEHAVAVATGVDADAGDVTGAGGESGVALLEGCPPSPAQRRELLGCWPTRHVGTWRGYFIGAPRYETLDGAGEEFPAGDLSLHLDPDGNGQLSFGADTGAAEAEDPCSGVALSGCPALGRLRLGFGYRLEEIELVDPDRGETPRDPEQASLRVGEQMSFAIRLGEPWQDRCTDRTPGSETACGDGACAKAASGLTPGAAPGSGSSEDAEGCLCGAQGCFVQAPSLRIRLRMSEEGKALRGVYTPDAPGLPDARLEFVRDDAQ
jgi:hypothetical protein